MPVQLDQTALIDDLMVALADLLELKLKLEPTDSAKAGIVREGKLQDDPTIRKINVLVHPGTEEHPDTLNNDFSPHAGFHTPSAYSLGGEFGSSFWRRHLVVQFEMMFPNQLSRVDARQRANMVISRARNAVMTWNVAREVGRDSFGEAAIGVQVTKLWVREGGGPGDFNWRGEMLVQFITELEPRGT